MLLGWYAPVHVFPSFSLTNLSSRVLVLVPTMTPTVPTPTPMMGSVVALVEGRQVAAEALVERLTVMMGSWMRMMPVVMTEECFCLFVFSFLYA